MKAVIIEDEEFTAKDLSATLRRCDSTIEIVALLDSVELAISYFENADVPDLIFSDIQLGDGLSFEIFKAKPLQCPIIYCTAYDHYALQAFRTLGVDYILKPFSDEDILNALDKLKTIKGGQNASATVNDELLRILQKAQVPQEAKTKNILITKGDIISPVPLNDIALFSLENQILYAYQFDGSRTAIQHKLNALEESCTPQFFRTSRQHLINRRAVKNAAHYFNRKLQVTLTVPIAIDIIVGKLKATQFMQWLAEN